MIEFRCWYCNKKYLVPEDRIGQRRRCRCGRRIKVPRYDGGSSRARTLGEWLIEAGIYGGGLSLLCMAVACGLAGRGFGPRLVSVYFVLICGTVGFLAGAFGGERVIDWVGQRIRNWEDDRRYGP